MEAFSKNQLERYPLYLKYFKELKAGGRGQCLLTEDRPEARL
jgi:hypothetical protein